MNPNSVIKGFNILKNEPVSMFVVNDIKSVEPFLIKEWKDSMLWLGMNATPDKREDKLLCPFHYFGITDLSIIGDDKAEHDFSIL